VYVIRGDGEFVRLTKDQIAVKGHLYTRVDESGERNTEIETWFADKIESPFSPVLDDLVQLRGLRTRSFKPDEQGLRMIQNIGYEVPPFLEFIEVTPERREIISSYVAALLVRNPRYLERVLKFHQASIGDLSSTELKNITLNNMLYVYEIYKAEIRKSDFTLTNRVGEHEFLFSDGGITAQEPWSRGMVPFQLHVPLTPDVSLGVVAGNSELDSSIVKVARVKNKVTSYHNRVVLSDAVRFVYSRGYPPLHFIKRYFGVPAPKVFEYRELNGRTETKFKPHRDPFRR
jgi:hypothetical protein